MDRVFVELKVELKSWEPAELGGLSLLVERDDEAELVNFGLRSSEVS